VSRHVCFQIAFTDKLCGTLRALEPLLTGVTKEMLPEIVVAIEAFPTFGAEEFLKN
jgi:hypothetical protein